MLCEIYIEALLAEENLADRVQEELEAGGIDDLTAYLAWFLIADDRRKRCPLLAMGTNVDV